jgi:hypothetical protein
LLSVNVLPPLRWLSSSFTCHAEASHLLPIRPMGDYWIPLHSPVEYAASPWIGVRWVCCSCVSPVYLTVQPATMSLYRATHTPVPLHLHHEPVQSHTCTSTATPSLSLVRNRKSVRTGPAIYPGPSQHVYGACHLPRSITVCTGPAIYPGPSQHVYGACHLPRSITACTCFPR